MFAESSESSEAYPEVSGVLIAVHEVLEGYRAVRDKVIWRDCSIVEHCDPQTRNIRASYEGVQTARGDVSRLVSCRVVTWTHCGPRERTSRSRRGRMSWAWCSTGLDDARRRLSTRTGLSVGRLQRYLLFTYYTNTHFGKHTTPTATHKYI